MRTATWFHASLKPIGRSAGRSAVACAAYRTGSRMEDERYAAVRDFSSKSDVVTSFTLAPEGAPPWAFDAEQLWNQVEARENRKNSQVAFEWEVALPNELDPGQREAIAREFSQWLVDEYGVAVTTGIHEGGNRGNGKNDHMHVMMTTREVGPDGWSRNKLREFATQPGKPNAEVNRVREQIADFINDALEDAGADSRVDHRSYQARGIEQEPTTHLGPAASAMERRGGDRTDRGDINRAIIEERLAWQQELAEPEISPELEREFSRRWEGWQPLARGGEAESAPALEPGTPADTSEEHRGWRRFADRMRAFQARALEFLADETSGTPEAERGWAARIFDAGRKLWGGWRSENGHAFGEGVRDAVELARDLAADPPRPPPPDATEGDASAPRSFSERLRHEAREVWRNERGSVPRDDFDRMAEQWSPEPGQGTEPHPPDAADPSAPEPEAPGPQGPDRDGPDIE